MSTLRQAMKVTNEPGLSPNNGLVNAFLSDQSMANNPRKGQAKGFAAETTSHDGKAGHVMTHHWLTVFVFFCFWVTGELSTLRQMTEVPNEPGLCPNVGLENTS